MWGRFVLRDASHLVATEHNSVFLPAPQGWITCPYFWEGWSNSSSSRTKFIDFCPWSETSFPLALSKLFILNFKLANVSSFLLVMPDALHKWEQPEEYRVCCCSCSDHKAGTQAFQAGGLASCCVGYAALLCLNMGMSGVHLVFHFLRFPSKQIPNQTFEFSSKKWTYSSVEEEAVRHSPLWCGVRGENADGSGNGKLWCCCKGFQQTTDPVACADQSSGKESPWRSRGDSQDLMRIADRLTLQASVAALL